MMTRIVSWFSADAAMPHDPRLISLPDNDYRWAYLCLLALEKRGELEGQNVVEFAHYCHVKPEKFPMILELLLEKRLVDGDFRPVDFNDWQKRVQKQSRDKRYNENKNTPPKNDAGTTQVRRESAQRRLSETERETERDKKKEQESGKPSVIAFAKQVLFELNTITGKHFSRTAEIEACIKRERCTIDEVMLVLNFKWQQWAGTDMQKNINPTTPFIKKHFQKYLDEARAGTGHVVAPKQGQQFGKFGVAERNKQAMEQVNKELGYGEDSQGVDGSCISVQRTDGSGQDQGLLDWDSGNGRESGVNGTEGSGEDEQVFP